MGRCASAKLHPGVPAFALVQLILTNVPMGNAFKGVSQGFGHDGQPQSKDGLWLQVGRPLSVFQQAVPTFHSQGAVDPGTGLCEAWQGCGESCVGE